MSLYPFLTKYDPVPPQCWGSGQMDSKPRGLLLHITDGDRKKWKVGELRFIKDGFIEKQNSTHWAISKSGEIYQFVPTDQSAKALGGGPRDRLWFSVENMAMPGDVLTSYQIATLSTLYAWLMSEYNIPLSLADRELDRGLGSHSMFGDNPDRTECPGKEIINQRSQILNLARMKYYLLFGGADGSVA